MNQGFKREAIRSLWLDTGVHRLFVIPLHLIQLFTAGLYQREKRWCMKWFEEHILIPTDMSAVQTRLEVNVSRAAAITVASTTQPFTMWESESRERIQGKRENDFESVFFWLMWGLYAFPSLTEYWCLDLFCNKHSNRYRMMNQFAQRYFRDVEFSQPQSKNIVLSDLESALLFLLPAWPPEFITTIIAKYKGIYENSTSDRTQTFSASLFETEAADLFQAGHEYAAELRLMRPFPSTTFLFYISPVEEMKSVWQTLQTEMDHYCAYFFSEDTSMQMLNNEIRELEIDTREMSSRFARILQRPHLERSIVFDVANHCAAQFWQLIVYTTVASLRQAAMFAMGTVTPQILNAPEFMYYTLMAIRTEAMRGYHQCLRLLSKYRQTVKSPIFDPTKRVAANLPEKKSSKPKVVREKKSSKPKVVREKKSAEKKSSIPKVVRELKGQRGLVEKTKAKNGGKSGKLTLAKRTKKIANTFHPFLKLMVDHRKSSAKTIHILNYNNMITTEEQIADQRIPNPTFIIDPEVDAHLNKMRESALRAFHQ